MFTLPRLKLYRKFLIIGVLSAAVFVVSSTSRVAANPCCVACLATYNSCTEYCYGLSSDPATEECLIGCGNNYEACSRACGAGLPVCPAV
jgi:hypothetical protein